MKNEYMLTAAARHELARIDMAIAELCKQKSEIYMRARTRCILETPEEIEAAYNLINFNTYGMRVVPNDGVVKIVKAVPDEPISSE